ncbi:LOW QUALITY PROTEIN: timeless [Arctopsyche grandis]|uniref:LOW QUALITY PROTEIN: timeless n=1 Tax=Arctopsyche grandis TaxID=121162 RepID=UPI00406D6AE2
MPKLITAVSTSSLEANMEWILSSPQFHSTFGSLGFVQGDTYHLSDDCTVTLEEIYKKLGNEDKNLRTFRRAVGFGQNIKKDLIPILIYVKDNPKIVDLSIKVLVNLTVPLECLLSIDESSKNNIGRHTIFELNNMLISSKQNFMDNRVTKSILDCINAVLENNIKLSTQNIESVNNCLLLLRNILHIPEMRSMLDPNSGHTSPQNQIVWNLFTQGIDKTILLLISSPYGTYWSVAIVQLIALIYKDQHITTLQKLLSIWFEASISDSSEDNESNTSPLDQRCDDSSPMLTSDPTSEVSDNGGRDISKTNQNRTCVSKMDYQMDEYSKNHNAMESNENLNDRKDAELIASNSAIIKNRLNNKRGPTTPLSHLICSGPNNGVKKDCMSTNSEFSDCGYVTQLENQESISTSSNEDDYSQIKPVHQKSHVQKHKHGIKLKQVLTAQEKKDKHRKKLVKRGKTNIINVKGLMHHIPTDDDITNVLKEFTVDFLLKGYGALIKALHAQLLHNAHLQIDTSHFFWLLTYFLKFAAQLELDLEFVNQVLSFEIIAYLTFEGVNLCEQIQLADKINKIDLQSCLRRLHLAVTAIREFIQTIEIYKKISHLTDEDRVQLVKLQMCISSIKDLRCLLILLLRHYQPDIHSKQYLQDLIVTNHILLNFLDNSLNRPNIEGTVLIEHLHQFATVEVMHPYGLLLQDFKTNGEYINDCIFTMMHHVGGDLNRINVLFQPNILKVFLTIWETGFELCDDWTDLLDYVINTFIKNPKSSIKTKDSEDCQLINYNESGNCESLKTLTCSWTPEEVNNLGWCYMKCSKKANIIETISSMYIEDGIKKTQDSIIRQLHKQGLISEDEFYQCFVGGSTNILSQESKCSVPIQVTSPIDEIERLKNELHKENMSNALQWLQKVLLEICFVKICLNGVETKSEIKIDQIIPTVEPVPFHNILINQSIPIVPWNNEQSTAIHNQTFLILLHHLGFHLPIDSGKLFVRIPSFWTTDVIFKIASRLGPIDESTMKFTKQQVFANVISAEAIDKISEFDLKINSAHQNSDVSNIISAKNAKRQKIDSIVEVTKCNYYLQILNIDIDYEKQTVISALYMYRTKPSEKNSSWLDVVKMKGSNTVLSAHNQRSLETPILNVLTDTVKISKETLTELPTFTTTPMIKMPDIPHMPIPIPEDISVCESESVTSDLTRMYVSDEED